MKAKQPWKGRLYAIYVSSGQAGDARAGPANYFSPRKPYIQAIIRQHIPPDRNLTILDLGCGHGAFLYFLQKAGYHNVHGVDISTEQVALAHKLGITTVEQADINSHLASVDSQTVDLVLLMDVLEHLTRQELFDVLPEVFRILRSGGKCIAHVPNAEGLFGMRIRYGDLSHEMAFTPKSGRQAFVAVGFRDVQCYEDKPVIHGVVSAARWLGWHLGTLPARLLLAAETGGTSFVVSQNMLVTALK
jgi:SAM-dependent methyltransferase